MPFDPRQVRSARRHLRGADPVMRRLVDVHGPFTARARSDRFAALVDAIISQQISTAAARTIRGRLRQAIEQRAAQGRSPTRAITAQAVLQLDLDELRGLGISRQKGAYLFDLAQRVQSGELNLRRMGRLDDESVIEQLVQVKGIGRWTAQMFLIFSLSRLDVLPVDDLGVRNAVQRQYAWPSLPTAADLESIGRPWRPFASVAAWYLWRSLES